MMPPDTQKMIEAIRDRLNRGSDFQATAAITICLDEIDRLNAEVERLERLTLLQVGKIEEMAKQRLSEARPTVDELYEEHGITIDCEGDLWQVWQRGEKVSSHEKFGGDDGALAAARAKAKEEK